MLWQGRVKVSVDVSENQKVTVKIKESSGYDILDNEVLETIKSYNFKENFREVNFVLSVQFKLK